MTTIVVGVDGSEGSVRALRYALAQAKTSGADVKAVTAWHIPALVYDAGWTAPPLDVEGFPKFAQAGLDNALSEAEAATSGVKVTTEVHKGQAADVLIEEAKDADLLVVGSRGLGGFRGLLLGSVSQQCAQHSSCPVVIVPAHEDRESGQA